MASKSSMELTRAGAIPSLQASLPPYLQQTDHSPILLPPGTTWLFWVTVQAVLTFLKSDPVYAQSNYQPLIRPVPFAKPP